MRFLRYFYLSAIYLSVCGVALSSDSKLPRFTSTITTTETGGPALAITNKYDAPIMSFALILEYRGTSIHEYRAYYDVKVNFRHDVPIQKDEVVVIPVPSLEGTDPSLAIRAVVYADGTTVGDANWISVLAARRAHANDRLYKIHDFISVGLSVRLTREAFLDKLEAQRLEELRGQSNDEVRSIDQMAFDSALSTFANVRDNEFERALSAYKSHLEKRILDLSGDLSFRGTISARGDLQGLDSLVDGGPTLAASPEVPPPSGSVCYVASHDDGLILNGGCFGTSHLYLPSFVLEAYFPETGDRVTFPPSFYGGSYWAYGTCFGGYNDCLGIYHPGDEKSATAHFHQATISDTQIRVYWAFDSWTNASSSVCDACAPNPSGVIFIPPVNNQWTPGFIYAACP